MSTLQLTLVDIVVLLVLLVGISKVAANQHHLPGTNGTEVPGDEAEGIIKCTDERQCKAACGSRASDTQCQTETGSCLCLNESGPPRRCRNVKHQEESCTDECKRRISQICHTDFGILCTCFVRN